MIARTLINTLEYKTNGEFLDGIYESYVQLNEIVKPDEKELEAVKRVILSGEKLEDVASSLKIDKERLKKLIDILSKASRAALQREYVEADAYLIENPESGEYLVGDKVKFKDEEENEKTGEIEKIENVNGVMIFTLKDGTQIDKNDII